MKPSSLCLLLCAGATVDPLGPKKTTVMQTSSHLGTGRRWGSSMLGPTRPNCDLQIHNTNRMDWKQTRPPCYTYTPPPPSTNCFSYTYYRGLEWVEPHLRSYYMPSWLGQAKLYPWPSSCQSRLDKKEDNWSSGQVEHLWSLIFVLLQMLIFTVMCVVLSYR